MTDRWHTPYGPRGPDDDIFGTVEPVLVGITAAQQRSHKGPLFVNVDGVMHPVRHDNIGRLILHFDGEEHRLETPKWIRARENELFRQQLRENSTTAETYRYHTILEAGQEEFQQQRREHQTQRRRQAERRRRQLQVQRAQAEEHVAKGRAPPETLLARTAEGQTRLDRFTCPSTPTKTHRPRCRPQNRGRKSTRVGKGDRVVSKEAP